jgi:septum formation protein
VVEKNTEIVIERIVLASKSPFRRALLDAAGIIVDSVDAGVDESAVVGPNPRETAQLRARAKALAAAHRVNRGRLVVGADQVVGFRGTVLDKATSAVEAHERITALQGDIHTLHSAMCLVIVGDDGPLESSAISWCLDVPMAMRTLCAEEIDAYVATGEWEGSVGCYKYEKQGSQLFELKETLGADQSAIIGLPLASLGTHLRRLGINHLINPEGPWAVKIAPY